MAVQAREYEQEYPPRGGDYAPRYRNDYQYSPYVEQATYARQRPYDQPPRQVGYEYGYEQEYVRTPPPRDNAPWDREAAPVPRPPNGQPYEPYQPRRARHARPSAEPSSPSRPYAEPQPPRPSRPYAEPRPPEQYPTRQLYQVQRRVMDDYAGHGLRARPSVASQAAALERGRYAPPTATRSQTRAATARASARRKRRHGPLVFVCVLIIAAALVVYLEAAGIIPPGLKFRATATNSLAFMHHSLMTSRG